MNLREPRPDAATASALACCAHDVHKLSMPDPGSRRRRLWDLDSASHCPVLGVCLPIELLRRLVVKVLHAQATDDDYRLHCIAVS